MASRGYRVQCLCGTTLNFDAESVSDAVRKLEERWSFRFLGDHGQKFLLLGLRDHSHPGPWACSEECEKKARLDKVLPALPHKRDCRSCGNRAMGPSDMNPYCAAVNKPWGRALHNGKPEECGPESRLWTEDVRKRA